MMRISDTVPKKKKESVCKEATDQFIKLSLNTSIFWNWYQTPVDPQAEVSISNIFD